MLNTAPTAPLGYDLGRLSVMKVRTVRAFDRERIHEILVATARFTADEVQWAMDLVDHTIEKPDNVEYLVHVAETEEETSPRVQGYVCHGPTPMTEGVFDLYWIAVDPTQQGQGLGQFLLKFVENEVRRQNGRMLLIETRGRQSFAPTRRFYQRSGYDEIMRIKDFYRVEDDKIVFCKKLAAS